MIIDWAIRHGLIPADAPGYLQLLAALRAGELA